MVQSIAAALVAVSTLAALPGKPEWQSDYGQALAATRSDQRPLLVVLDIPAKPDAALDENLLAIDGEQAELLAAYELCHVDASTEYGQKVAEAFGATQFPHTAIIDRTGAVVIFKQSGRIGSGQWVETLARYKSGQRPVTSTSFFRGGPALPGAESLSNPAYCPACQRAAMGM
ncbi:MAG TPA: hypothetical protein PKC18_20775 [Lacipirellulaceae bacterium]|nr:hypothetical protein [Lacipirellulaceae bacterium]HMP08609.1 hypothetical protein [Lacipirellulaceae bacterium]